MSHPFYPKGPAAVPADLTAPARSYKKHVGLATATLLLFILFYIFLSSWFVYTSFKLFANTFSGGKDGVLSFITAVLLGFLGVFMFKGLFFFTRKNRSEELEITEKDEPELFRFIYQVADDAKAPRPHKVYLSNSVNACVFYDISVINLIFPSQKNLEIGLGLINTLNLGEFKSILAHEFGHFTQRSMIIGRWVYIAYQVSYQIIARRDALDRFLNLLSGVDIRVAWIGWLLSIIIWSIRSFSEFFFKLVLISQRALSREMEFHADLVAVSLTGSDALVNSLYKLTPADEAYEEAIEFANRQLGRKKIIPDIYALQSNAISQMAVVLNNPGYGASPIIPEHNASSFRVFREQIAQTPKMWMTHPPNIERERNAKRVYLPTPADNRSSWVLFKDPDAIKSRLTKELFKHIETPMDTLGREESLELQGQDFRRSFLLPKYRGIYLNRPVFISYNSYEDIYKKDQELNDPAVQFGALYPLSLQSELARLKDLDEELALLVGLNKKVLDASEGKIRYRGQEISREELPATIQLVEAEAQTQKQKIEEHDVLSRSLHLAAAKKLGNNWDLYLMSLARLIHFSEHAHKRVEQMAIRFHEVLALMTSGGRVNASEMHDLVVTANDLYEALEEPFRLSTTIHLNEALKKRLDGKNLAELFGNFELGRADEHNINNWIKAVDSWSSLVLSTLKLLREATLDELLSSEEYVENVITSGTQTIEQAPPAITGPDNYYVYGRGSERPMPERSSLFGKFRSGKSTLYTAVRVMVAVVIIVAAVLSSGSIGSSNVEIYNGLPVQVTVYLGDRSITVEPMTSEDVRMDSHPKLLVTATTTKGDTIESFSPELESYSKTYIYNIAHAAVLYTWKAYYGYQFQPPSTAESMLGAPRWMGVDVDDYFTDPPQSMSLKQGSTAVRNVLNAYRVQASQLVPYIFNAEERDNFLRAHALWEDKHSPTILSSLVLAADLKDFGAILASRLKRDPYEVVSLRMQQEVVKGMEKAKVCAAQEELYRKNPANPDLYYLNCRCNPDEAKKDSGFAEGNRKWPDHPWLAFATGFIHVQNEAWEKALVCYNTAYRTEPVLREVLEEDMQRIYGMVGNGSPLIEFSELHSPYLDYVKEINYSTASTPEGRFYAYRLLSEGKIEDALAFAKPDSNVYRNVLILAALSKGTSKVIEDEAAATEPGSLNRNTIMPVLALAIRRNQPLEPYNATLKAVYAQFADTVTQFINFTRAGNLRDAEKRLQAMQTETKARACLLGVMVLGPDAPLRWKELSSKLLFVNEKPYLP